MIEFAELLVKCEQLLWLLMEKWSSGQFNPISQDEKRMPIMAHLLDPRSNTGFMLSLHIY